MPLAAVVRIVNAVASALAAAHAHGVVHRDLKPANIFLDTVDGQTDEVVKVLDFGISQVRSSEQRLSQPNHVLGTPSYMAPEQVRGAVETVDGRADQFALGAIAYRMLTGREAFRGHDTPALLYQIVHERPPPLAEHLPAGWDPRPLQEVLDRALAKQPEQRWGGMMELARAFEDAAERTMPGLLPEPATAVRPEPAISDEPPPIRLPADPATRLPGAAGPSRAPARRSTGDPLGSAERRRSDPDDPRPGRGARRRRPRARRAVDRDRLVPAGEDGDSIRPGEPSGVDLAPLPARAAARRPDRHDDRRGPARLDRRRAAGWPARSRRGCEEGRRNEVGARAAPEASRLASAPGLGARGPTAPRARAGRDAAPPARDHRDCRAGQSAERLTAGARRRPADRPARRPAGTCAPALARG